MLRKGLISLAFALSSPVWAAESDSSPVTPSSPPQEASALTDADEQAVSDAWRREYAKGFLLAESGAKVGLVGGITFAVGLGLLIAGVTTHSGRLADFGTGPLEIGGIAGMAVGGLTAAVGAPMAAAGITRSHRALVDGGVTDRACGGCIAAWAMAIPFPTPLYMLSLSGSYGVSTAQRRSHHAMYRNAEPLPKRTMRISPTLSPNGPRVAMTGTF